MSPDRAPEHDHDADCIDTNCTAEAGTCCEHCSGWRPLAAAVVARARIVVDRWKAPLPPGESRAAAHDAFRDAVVELEHALDALDHPDEQFDPGW
jgi:hypothetical protein